jgi:hypothetical protein
MHSLTALKYELCNIDYAYGLNVLTFVLKLVFFDIKISGRIHVNNLYF